MNKSRVFIAALLLFYITASVSALGSRDTVTVTGVVRLVGNEPFAEIVITGDNGEWYVARDEIQNFRDLQHMTVTVKGIETVTELTFASGMPAGTRRELKRLRLFRLAELGYRLLGHLVAHFVKLVAGMSLYPLP